MTERCLQTYEVSRISRETPAFWTPSPAHPLHRPYLPHFINVASFHSIQLQNTTQNAPKLAFLSSKMEKFSREGGTDPSPDHTPCMERDTPSPNPTHMSAFGASLSVPWVSPSPASMFLNLGSSVGYQWTRHTVKSSHGELVTQWTRHSELVTNFATDTVKSSHGELVTVKLSPRKTVNSSHSELVTMNSSQWIRHQKVKSSHSERVTAYLNTITVSSRSNISQYELIYQLIFPPSTFSRLVGLHWLQTADFISLFCRTCLAPYCRAI